MSSDSLQKRTIRGLGWSVIDNLSGSGITFLVGIVLARILSPIEFGVIGILSIFIAIANSIVDCGFSNALIRKQDVTEEDYNTVFYINLALGGLMYLLLFFFAPWLARFFCSPILGPTLRIMSIVLFFNALSMVQKTKMTKCMDFKTQAKISIMAFLISAAVGIGMALKDFGVWALVGQQLSRQFCNMSFLWFFSQWKPKLLYSWSSFRELFSFGSKLLVSGLIDTIYQNLYQFVIGKFYTKENLGQYTRAQQFQAIFSSNLTAVIQKVTYPALSLIQNDAHRLSLGYRKIIKYSMAVSSGTLVGLAVVAKPLLFFLIGEKWLPAVGYLQIICFSGMLYPLHAINLNILQVRGRSDLFLRLEIVKKIIASLTILVGIFCGVYALLIGSVVASWFSFFLNAHYSGVLINYSVISQLKDIFPPILISLVAWGIGWLFTFTSISHIVTLLIQLVVGGGLLIFLYYFFCREIFDGLKTVLYNLLPAGHKSMIK